MRKDIQYIDDSIGECTTYGVVLDFETLIIE